MMLKLEKVKIEVGKFSLTNINLEVNQGDYLVILGSNGAGKTILLESIVGINKIKSGNIFYNNEEITENEINKRNLCIVYQTGDLFPHMSVFDNIAFPLKNRNKKNIREKVLEISIKVGVKEKLNQKPETLSGGETQRVAIARSLATGYKLFLLDEPFSSLDNKSKNELKMLLRNLNREGFTFIHVTHDYEEAISLASKIAILENGTIVDINEPELIFKYPKSEFVANFIGHKNFLKGRIEPVRNSDLKKFISENNLEIYCLTDLEEGDAYLIISSNDISISNQKEISSNRNNFSGKILDISKAKIGYEVIIDLGYKFAVSISKESIENLDLSVGKEVWISFKASACKIYR